MHELLCRACGIRLPIEVRVDRCPRCGGPLSLRKEYSELPVRDALATSPRGLWGYAGLLPPTVRATATSLGEPVTPVIEAEVRLGGAKAIVLLKNEGLMPTGSFKDRGSAVLVSHLRFLGVSEAVTDSSGNAGASMAAYSRNCGLRLTVYAPSSSSREKLKLIELMGARLVLAPSREEATSAAMSSGLFYANHAWNPLFVEGVKTFVYEALGQLGGFDTVYVPLGSGTMLLGVYEALREIEENVPSFSPPEVVVVRPEGYPVESEGEGAKPCLAEGIAIRRMHRRAEVREAIGRLGARVVYVRDEHIVSALKALLSRGVLAEPTGAAALAGLLAEHEATGAVPRGRVLVPVTGTGLKSLEKLVSVLA